MYIPIILGTARKGRRSEAVAVKLEELVRQHGIETEIFDVRESYLRYTGDSGNEEFLEKWKKSLNNAIGFLIVVPEYNHGYPGELKLFLDSTFGEYKEKLVGIVSVANGLWGGTRVTEQLRPVLNTFNTIVLGTAIHLRNVGSMIENGEYINPEFPDYVDTLVGLMKDLGQRVHQDKMQVYNQTQ